MALSKGVNSYLTVAEANDYFTNRIDVDSWDAANDAKKEKALITASLQFNNLNWVGTLSDDDQDLAFPRDGSYYDPMAGKQIVLDPLVVPNRILLAVCEQAYYYINNTSLLDASLGPTEITVDGITLKGLRASGQSRTSPIARAYYEPLEVVSRSSNSWFRAN